MVSTFVAVSGEELFERLEKWVQSLDDQTEWATLAIELQLHANRSPAFSELFAVFNSKQQAQFGRLIEVLFDKHDLIPPAPPIQLARHFIALTHGLAIEEGGLVSNAILVFLRALMASAQRK
ncbi:hypothetical protein WJT86_08215 [Microvirga sp. W0021]|uniref:Uncharacterized protein n=1 Tax=Hohaiivirga grylli TaxID=3133970 RepID=A0ABV0BJ54_9HYPH